MRIKFSRSIRPLKTVELPLVKRRRARADSQPVGFESALPDRRPPAAGSNGQLPQLALGNVRDPFSQFAQALCEIAGQTGRALQAIKRPAPEKVGLGFNANRVQETKHAAAVAKAGGKEKAELYRGFIARNRALGSLAVGAARLSASEQRAILKAAVVSYRDANRAQPPRGVMLTAVTVRAALEVAGPGLDPSAVDEAISWYAAQLIEAEYTARLSHGQSMPRRTWLLERFRQETVPLPLASKQVGPLLERLSAVARPALAAAPNLPEIPLLGAFNNALALLYQAGYQPPDQLVGMLRNTKISPEAKLEALQRHRTDAQVTAASSILALGDRVPPNLREALQRIAAPLTVSTQPPAGPAVGSAEFEKLLDEKTDSRSRENNRITLMFGGQTNVPMRDLLFAEHRDLPIYVQTFVQRAGDETGDGVARRLAAHARRAPARYIADLKGSEDAGPQIYAFMEANGVDVAGLAWGLTDNVNRRDHQKGVLYGNRAFITGDANLADEYGFGGSDRPYTNQVTGLPMPSWQGTDLVIEGPLVNDAAQLMLRNLEAYGATIPADERATVLAPPHPFKEDERGGIRARLVRERSVGATDDAILQLDVAALNGARDRITIVSPYFSPHPLLQEALLAAAKRGVKVRVLTTDPRAIDFKMAAYAARHTYPALMAAGVQIFEIDPMDHGKTIAVDGKYARVGSANLNGRSSSRDAELAIAFESASHVDQLQEHFDRQLATAAELYPGDLYYDEKTHPEPVRYAASGLLRKNV